jgi:hypothetical protein
MSVESTLADMLAADATVSALVAGRIYALAAPQNTAFPFVTYAIETEAQARHMGGTSSLERSQFEARCWAATYEGARDLAQAARAALNGFADERAVPPIHSMVFFARRDQFDEASGAFGRVVEIVVTHDAEE